MNSIEVKGEARPVLGKKATKAVRNEEAIPCVLYGKSDVVHFQTTASALRHLIFSGEFKIVDLAIGADTTKAILKDVQFHPVNEKIMHVDFLKLYDGVPVKVDLPLKTQGASPGVKVGGKMIQNIRKIKVKTLPEKLVNELFVDISSMELGQSLRVKDIIPIDGIEVLQNSSIPVVTIEIPRALRSATAAATTPAK